MPSLPASPERGFAHVPNLIRHTGELVKHQRELERVSGELFNLFHILRIGHYEVSTHSPLLGDLLD